MKKKRRRCKETKHYRRVVRNRVQEIFGRYDKLCNNNTHGLFGNESTDRYFMNNDIWYLYHFGWQNVQKMFC